jgi:serine/threonine protein kinase
VSRVSAEVGSAANSYEVLAKLAMGGMAEIFLARGASAAGVERYVVLKRVLRHKSSDTHFVSMFLDEARLAAQLQHPNIAQVYDIGKLGDSFFFTMEYVHGETIRNLLQRSHALRQHIPISAVLSVIAGAAAGLQHAHDRKGMDGKPLGIVHRDVSPSNLMVSYEGTVKVVDFGVAKAAHRSTETRSGTVKGKITYMSPEQCRGLDIDRRSDLFSLGIVMWEMLTIDRLYRRNSDFDNMQAIVSEEVPAPSTIRAGIPPEIDRIVMRLLAKDPAARFQTGDELHEAVEAAAVATGSALSASSLGRYMREIFGQRPEPWIELMSQLSHPEAHTVTGEPLAGGPAITSPSDELDVQLSAVPLLSQRMTAQQEPAARPPMLTVPLRVQIDDLALTMHRDAENNVVPMPPVQSTVPMRAQSAPPWRR